MQFTTIAILAASALFTTANPVQRNDVVYVNAFATLSGGDVQQQLQVPVNGLGAGPTDPIERLTIDASTPKTDSITCQAFKDADGTIVGSAVFRFASPALIATNPVTIGSIRCNSTAT